MAKLKDPNQLSIESMISEDALPELIDLYKGDKILVINGHHKDRTGRIYKMCSRAFPGWCRVEFDLAPRERTKKTSIIQKIEIKAIR